MIKEAINSILEAEKEADKIVKQANAEALEMVADAKKQHARIKTDTRKRLEEEARNEYARAAAEGDKKAEEIFAKCREEIKKLAAGGESNAQKAKQFIKRRLVDI
jgi:vacuolar-type H+-ATPase subunit H